MRYPASYSPEGKLFTPPPFYFGGVLFNRTTKKPVKVDGITNALVPWPAYRLRGGRWDGRLVPILCGQLVDMVCTEAVETVSDLFGVCAETVLRWQKSLRVSKRPSEAQKNRLKKISIAG